MNRETKVAEGNADADRLATTQGMKEAKRLAAALTVAENRLTKECDRYQKCTARLHKADAKLETATIEAEAAKTTLQYLDGDDVPRSGASVHSEEKSSDLTSERSSDYPRKSRRTMDGSKLAGTEDLDEKKATHLSTANIGERQEKADG